MFTFKGMGFNDSEAILSYGPVLSLRIKSKDNSSYRFASSIINYSLLLSLNNHFHPVREKYTDAS